MKSMTGYGKCELSREGRVVTVECKTVNNRFLDLSVKMPKVFLPFEDALRKTISANLARGRCDVYVSYRDEREIARPVRVDTGLAEGYFDAYTVLRDNFPVLEEDFTVSTLMKCPDVVRPELPEEDEEVLKALLLEAAENACAALNGMRETEGKNIAADLAAKLAEVEAALRVIKGRAPGVVADYREKLRARMEEALSGIAVDEARLLNEVAFFCDKASIDEEIARLESHIAQMRNMLKERTPQGRKLDFLVQEFNREANTICSKSNDLVVTEQGLRLKSEIEKIREQVQNVE